jgi:hypothetical protein
VFVQYALIVLQNTLFIHRQEIKAKVSSCTNMIAMNREEAFVLKETLQLYLAMQERAECKITRSSDQEIVDEIVRNHQIGVRKAKFVDYSDKISLSELIHETRKERDMGNDVELDTFLDAIVKKYDEDEEPHRGANP